MGQRMKRIFASIIGVAIVILLVMAFVYGRKLGKTEADAWIEERKLITEDVLKQQMEGIGELNTAKYYYTNMGRYENTLQFNGQNIPFTQKSFIISYDGTIKAGVELQSIAVELTDKKIRMTIPEAAILSHDVDMKSVTVFDEKNSIFNGLSTEDARINTKDCLNTLFQALLQSEDYAEGYILEFIME